MSLSLQQRVVAFAVGLVAMLVFMAVSAASAWHHLEAVQERLGDVHLESFRMADKLRHGILNLNRTVLRDRLRPHPGAWPEFLKASGELTTSMVRAQPQMRSRLEQDTLKLLRSALDDFLEVAREVELGSGPDAPTNTSPNTSLDDLEVQTERMLDLTYRLAEAHGQSVSLLLADSHRSLLHLRTLFLVGSVLLTATGVVLAGVLYRGLIAPLRMQLVRAETLAKQHEKLASLGLLAAGVAHEIRNPLTAIRARVFTLRKRLTSPSAEMTDVSVIDQEIDRLERIVKDVLLFARPSDPQRVRLTAANLLHEVLALLGPQLEARQISSRLDDSTDVEVEVDPAQIKQVLINLIQNAAEAIGRAGEIRLRAYADRHLLGRHITDVVILEVADNGKGIPAEVQKRLFDPFFTTKESGTGLGLSIAARIVDLHDGVLRFQTEPDRGTTFGVVLPQAKAEQAVPGRSGPPSTDAHA